MTKEEAKTIISESIRQYGVADVSDDYKEGFNDGVGFMGTLIEMSMAKLTALLECPPHLD